MRLATPAEVLAVLGVQAGTGSLANAGAALDATFSVVESKVDSMLERVRRKDWFSISKYDTERPRLRLSSGFVTRDEPVVVTISGAAVDASGYYIDYDLGVVHLLMTLLEGVQTVSVAFSCGFEADTADTTQLQSLPQGLRQGGIAMAAAYFLSGPANSPKEKARFLAETSINAFELRANQNLSKYERPRGSAIWADYTEAVE